VSAIDRERAGAREIETRFPGWEAWRGTDQRWHARLKGHVPRPGDYPAGDDLEDLREEIVKWLGRHEER